MAFSSSYFEYDNISSDTMGVQLINVDSGLVSNPFGYEGSAIVEKIKARDKEYFFGVDKSPLKFTIAIAPLEGQLWTKEFRMRIAEWLFQSQYKPFVSGDNLDVIYYCMVDGSSTRYDTTLGEGYVTLTFVCNSPYAFSPTFVDTYDYSTALSNIVTLDNLSNVERYYYPEVEITMVNSTDVSITNLTNGNELFSFTGLTIGEIVHINNQSKQIISSLADTYRLDKFNKTWLRLVKGSNRLQITGDVQIVFKSSYPLIV